MSIEPIKAKPMSLISLSIRTRLAFGFGLLMTLMIVVAGTTLYLGFETSSAVYQMNRTSMIASSLKDSLLNIRSARALTWYYMATGDDQALKDRDAAFKKSADQYAVLDKLAISATGHQLVADFNESVIDFETKARRLTALKSKAVAGSETDYRDAIADAKAATAKYAASNDKAVDYYKTRCEFFKNAFDDALGQLQTISSVIGAVGLLIGIVCAWLISKSIAGPIADMTKAMGAIANGDLSVAVPALSNKDEVGAMAKAVQIFKDNGLKLRASEADAARQRLAVDQERTTNEATRVDIQRRQEAVVASLANGLDRLSKGDLTGRLSQAFSAEYEKLRADFNATAESLQDALGTIAVATDGISTGSDQIAHASDDLSRRTEQQAASLEETAAALNVITDTVKAMATNAGAAAKVVVATRSAAETSGAIVQQAVDAMGKIKQSSQQITNIIGVIDEIAFQTNLLALNAGVEAARAGDAGRGFAVVASEVRGLAQRSAEAAKEIKALISASTVQVESGVVLVDKTGLALKDIVVKVAEMDGLVRQISAASQEQATGLAEINTAVSQMDQVVQQNAAMVEESTAAAHALKAETQDLSTMVGRFQLGGTDKNASGGHRNSVHAAQAKVAAFARR